MPAPVYDKLIAEIRLDLGQPETHAPGDDLICQRIADAAQILRLQQMASPVQWSAYYYDIQARANTARYSIVPSPQAETLYDLSKPVRIHTIDAADRLHVNRQIRICERQHVGEHYDGPAIAQDGTDKHSAAVMVVDWQDDIPYVEIVPTPREAATYRLWYESGGIPDPTQTSERVPVLAEFYRYLRYKAAFLLLPYAEWNHMDAEKWAARRVELTGGFVPAIQEFEAVWQRYIRTSRQAGSGRANVYAEWYDDDWEF